MIEVVEAPKGVFSLSENRRKMYSGARYVEFLGGAGDLINRCHQCDWYTSLMALSRTDRVLVGYLVHNMNGLDLFRWIPTPGRVLVMNIGFSANWNDPSWRSERGLPEALFHPYDIRRIDYYPSREDIKKLDGLYRIGPYVAFCMSAGTMERNIPGPVREAAATAAIAAGFKVVQVGGTYKRNAESPSHFPARDEVRLEKRYGVFDMIDELSFAGSLKVIERAAGVFTTHTALCLASWYTRQPTFLLYNDFVKRQYVPLGAGGYLFGMDRLGNDHMEFSEYTDERFSKFLKGIA